MIRCIGRCSLLALLLVLVQPATAAAAAVGELAPDFALPAATGGNVRLSEHRGEVVLLAFWSSRCAVCATQLSRLGDLQTTYRSAGLTTLAISVDDDISRAARFARAHPVRFPMLLDLRKGVSRAYGIERLPTTVLIDRRGRVRFLQSDEYGIDNSYVAQLRELLDDPL
ncbi:MAG TPA: peroxiredoxin family protein [Steroidobacteraceae bacterium]